MKKYIKYIIFTILIVLVPLATKYGITYGKYAYNSIWNYYLKSKGFYFTSDTLTNKNKIVNNLWDGAPIYIDLKNSLNEAIASEHDISYKVNCSIKESSSPASCTILDTDKDFYEGVLSSFKTCTNNKGDGVDVKKYDKTTCEIGGYTWENQPALKNIYFNVQSTDKEIDYATVQITVTSTSPYKKVMANEFVLTKDKNSSGLVSLNYESQKGEGKVILTNSYEEEKCVKLNWNSNNLKLDINKQQMQFATDNLGYINEITFKIRAQSSMKFNFYETHSKEFSSSDFTLTEIDQC